MNTSKLMVTLFVAAVAVSGLSAKRDRFNYDGYKRHDTPVSQVVASNEQPRFLMRALKAAQSGARAFGAHVSRNKVRYILGASAAVAAGGGYLYLSQYGLPSCAKTALERAQEYATPVVKRASKKASALADKCRRVAGFVSAPFKRVAKTVVTSPQSSSDLAIL